MIRTIGHRRDPGNGRVDVIRPRCQLAARPSFAVSLIALGRKAGG